MFLLCTRSVIHILVGKICFLSCKEGCLHKNKRYFYKGSSVSRLKESPVIGPKEGKGTESVNNRFPYSGD